MKLNQRDLAGRLGVKQQTVSRWESGIAVPFPVRVVALAQALDVEPGWLLQQAGYLGESWGDLRQCDELRAELDALEAKVGELTAEWSEHQRLCPIAQVAS